MFNKATLALLLAAGLTLNAFAADIEQPRTHSSERPIETTTLGLPLPRVAPGSMTLRPCDDCLAITLDITAQSQFFVGRTPVTYADLHVFAQKADANAVVFFDTRTNAVTRIVVSGTP